jgi:mRNA interferase MazF
MVTTAQRSRWENDIPLSDLSGTGLKHASLVRFKIFTLDATLPLRALGTLAEPDRLAVIRQLRHLLPQSEIWH